MCIADRNNPRASQGLLTLGDAAGYSAGAPVSPAEATNVTPVWPAGVAKVASTEDSEANSELPQLSDTTETPG